MIHSYHCQYSNAADLKQFIEFQHLSSAHQVLVQIYCNQQHMGQLEQVRSEISLHLPGACIVGTSSYGWFEGEYVSRSGLLISFTTFEQATVDSWVQPLGEDHFATGVALASRLCRADTKVLIVFADALSANADELLAGISEVAQEVMVAGAMSADQWLFEQTYVCDSHTSIAGGVVAASLSGAQLSALNHYMFGWRPIGKKMRITHCDGGRVFRINGETAQRIYANYLGEHVKDSLLHRSVDFPLMLERNGLLVARAPMQLHDDGSISFAGSFIQGETVTIAYGDVAHITRRSQAEFSRLPTAQTEAMFVYSCAGRCNYLQQHVQRELEPLAAHNCSGFFSYGELYHGPAGNELLNHTVTYLLLAEECELPQLSNTAVDVASESLALDGLFHLVKVSSEELTALNNGLELKIEAKKAQLQRELFVDRMTGLPNRNQLLADLDAKDGTRPMTLGLIDIDQFRQFNDIYGFEIGDAILKKVANRCMAVLAKNPRRDHLRLYKLPSDEFAITSSLAAADSEFIQLIDSIKYRVEQREMKLDDNRFSVQFSCGIAFDGDRSGVIAGERQPLLTKADMALRQARMQGSDREIFALELPIVKTLEQNLSWAERLKAAIRENRVEALYQPIFSADGLRVMKFESLVRLVSTDGSWISPYFFLNVAKQSRLYHHLTQIVLAKSVNMIRTTGKEFSVNLSLLDLKHTSTMALIDETIADPHIGPLLTFEIVESEGFEDYSLVSEFIHKVKRAGCKIAIDDFGAGYSSFARIANLNVDYLKVDGSLIKTVDIDNKLRAVTSSIVQFANTLDIQTTAEFVHSQSVQDAVIELGFSFAQGFHLSEPLPEAEVIRLLAEWPQKAQV